VQKDSSPPTGRNGHDAASHPASGDAPAPQVPVDLDAKAADEQAQMPETDAFVLLLRQLRELCEYVSYYFSARADSAKVGLRNVLLGMTLAALAFVVVAGLCVSAVWLVLMGTAEGLGVLFGNRPWAGNLLTGLLLVAGLGGGICGIVIKLKKTARERTVAHYENRQSRQQVRYGHNVADRAAAHRREPK